MEIHKSLGYLINKAAICSKRYLDFHLKEFNITTSQWALLKLLSEENSLSQAEISDRLLSDRATTGAIIDKLIEKELLIKALSKKDRRSYLVSLTEKAANIIEVLTAKAENCNFTAVKGLTEDEKAILSKCLETIIMNLSGEEKVCHLNLKSTELY